MNEPRFGPGDRVRTALVDPPHHTRLPRYARGHVGEIVDVMGTHPLPDDRARHLPTVRVEPVYTVRFAARDLWGEGDHCVTVELWESYLTPAGERMGHTSSGHAGPARAQVPHNTSRAGVPQDTGGNDER